MGTQLAALTALSGFAQPDDLFYRVAGNGASGSDRKVAFNQIHPGVWLPTALTDVGIQAAHDAALTAGGGVVWLGASTYVCTTTIVVDPTKVSIEGAGALLDGSSGSQTAILQAKAINTSSQYGHGTQRLRGFRVKGNGSGGTQAGIYLHSPTISGLDRSSRITLQNLDITACGSGIKEGDNAFCYAGFGLSINGCGKCLEFAAGTNAGENTSWHGCIFFNSGTAIYTRNGAEAYFYGCSFDYCTTWVDSYGLNEFHSCHFEKSAPTSGQGAPFKLDGGGRILLFGGMVLFAGGPSGEAYVFAINGNTATRVFLSGVQSYNLTYGTALSNASGQVTGSFLT